METEPTDGSKAQSFEFLLQRVAALELILEHVLPMLIQDAPHQQDIRATLEEWAEQPPERMQENYAFVRTVDRLLDDIPDA